MKAEATSTCQTCGARVPAGLDFCPVCALLRAGGQESAPSEALNPASDSERNSAETEPASIARRFENYEVMLDQDGKPVELGRGAMGITYKAFDIDLRFPVTLKVIGEKYVGDESARLRFLRAARAAAKVRHTNVASVLHLGRTGSGYFYAMEFVEGETLESLIKRSGRLEVKLALEIASQVAAGLDAICDHKLVHRDIKPTNIMVRLKDEGRVTAKIIDLGLAKEVSELGSASEISTPGAFAGTPAFASPEQFAGLGADIRSDLYSLGVTLWEMLAGQVPFRGSPSELMREHQQAPLPLEQLKGLPQAVVVLLEVVLEKDPAQRFQSPAELLKAIPLVTAAINGGRTVTPQELRAISEEGAFQKSGKFSGPARTLFRSSRFRLLGWLVGGLLIGGIAILAVNDFFRVNHQAAKSPVTPSASIETSEKSIAVLPFDNISSNKEDAYFADGVQDEILNNLAKIAQLKVISRTSVMQYRADNKRDLRHIANALGVANVLEGTVRRDGNHVRVSTELVDARNDNTIWAESYDRNLTDIFAIQSEIAQKVASRLSAQLSPEERKDIEEKPTDNLDAYDLYLQAKQLLQANYWVLQKDEKEIYQRIISLLENATAKDSHFALAYCLSAKAHDILYVDRIDHTPGRRALGDAAVNEALRLRPDLPEAHLAMASHLYYCYRNFDRARVQIAMAAQGLSNNPEVLELTALIDRVQGRWEQSTTGLERATALDPRNSEVLGHLADNYGRLRRYRDCEEIFNRLIALEPDNPTFLLGKINWIFSENADVKGARAACEAFPSSIKADPWVANQRFYYATCARDFAAAEKMLNEIPNQEIAFLNARVPRQIVTLQLEFVQGNRPAMKEFAVARAQLCQQIEADPSDPWLITVLALTDVALGRKDEGIQEGQRALEMRPISEDAWDGPVVARNVAIVYATADQLDAAFEQLNRLIQMPADPLTYGDLKTCPCWDPLRKDPRFDKLLAELAPREPAEKSIAVLPFDNISPNKDDAYFADGVQDEILNNLAKIAQLKVISRTSVMQYRADSKRDLRQIATALGVANVLEGTVRRDGNHVRVSTELVDARNDNTIWADSYDRDLTDIFTIQSEVAQIIATKLTATLSPEEKKRIEARPTDNLDAYDLYLQAKELIAYAFANPLPTGNYEKPLLDSINLLEQAVGFDPKFTLAYCASAKAHDRLYNGYDMSLTRRALGDAAVEHALHLQPDLPEVHLANAFHLYYGFRDYERARVQLAIATHGLPNSSEALILEAYMSRRQGNYEKAVDEFNEAIIRDPRNPRAITELANTLFFMRQFAASVQAYDRAIDLAPDLPILKVLKTFFVTLMGTGDRTAVHSALATLPAPMTNDRDVLTWRLTSSLYDRDWRQAADLVEKMKGGEDDGGQFFTNVPVPVDCYLILIARFQGEQADADPSSHLAKVRERLSEKVQRSAGNARQLSNLAIVDALLGKKQDAIAEAKRAVEMSPISRDALDGPSVLEKLAQVYAWTDELDLAFEQAEIAAKIPNGVYYGDLKLNPFWDPLRKDPRFEKLLAELAPRD